MRKKVLIGLLAGCAVAGLALARPVPKRLVMLTFDDAALIYATYVAPLQEYGFGFGFGFGATLFVYGLRQPAFADRSLYMGWAQIRALVRQGFEVDRHPLLHRHVTQLTGGGLVVKLDLMGSRCRAWSIRWPATVAYPGYDTVARAWPGLWARGYRRGQQPLPPRSGRPAGRAQLRYPGRQPHPDTGRAGRGPRAHYHRVMGTRDLRRQA